MTTPCCNKPCWVAVEQAQLLLWPTPAPLPNVTTLVDNKGFTLYVIERSTSKPTANQMHCSTSPSIYIAYTSVAGRGLWGCSAPVGPSYASLTRGYALSEISTLVSPPDNVRQGPHAPNGPQQVLNPADLFTNCSSVSYNPSSYDTHCYPSLIYPHGLRDADPAWQGCTNALQANTLFVPDPPRVLTPVGALDPATTKDTAPLGVISASPASTLSSPSVRKTDTSKVLVSDSRSAFDPQQPSSVKLGQTSILNVNTDTERLTAKESPFVVEPSTRSTTSSDARDLPLDGTLINIVVKPQSLSDSSDHSDATKVKHVDSVNFEEISKTPDGSRVTSTIISTLPTLDKLRGDSSVTEHLWTLGALASKMLHAFRPLHSRLHDPSQPTTGTHQGLSSLQHINSLPSETASNIPLRTVTNPSEPLAVSFAVIDQGGLSLAGTVYRSGLVMIAESTLQPGKTAIPIQGHRFSIDPAASELIVDGQTMLLPFQLAEAQNGVATHHAHPSITSIVGNVAQGDSPLGIYIINGQAITRGGESATISGTPVGFNADENLVIGTSIIRGLQKPSFLDRHPILTVGSLTLTFSVADQGQAYITDGPAQTSQQSTIGSQTPSASSQSGEVAIAETTISDKPTATSKPGSVNIYGSKDAVVSTFPEPTSTSEPENKAKGSTHESIFTTCSSCLTRSTSEMSEIIISVRVFLISILTFCYLILN